jgi:hypothetical protein
MADRERSTDDIRQDIAREEENLSRTAQEIGNRLKQKLDWRAYVKDSPYCALGTVAALGFLASRMMQPHRTPMERVMHSIADEVRDLLGDLNTGKAPPGIIQATLLGIATKIATDAIKNANLTAGFQEDTGTQTDPDSTINPKAAF